MDQKEKIKKAINNVVKNSNFYYSKAKKSRIKDRKNHDQNKKLKLLRKNLSKDNFNQYVEALYKDDNK